MRFTPIGLRLAITSLLGVSLVFALFAQKPKKKEEPSDESFVNDALVISQLGKVASVSFYSLRGFTCHEQLRVEETGKTLPTPVTRQFSSTYEVRQEKPKATSLQRGLIELRSLAAAEGKKAVSSSLDFPTLEKPFTGFLTQMFTSENRLNLDFKKVREEEKNGHKCALFDFQPMQYLDPLKIELMGEWISLIQSGQVWVDVATSHPVLVFAKQMKLPKQWRLYHYEAEFQSVPALGPNVIIPTRLKLTVSAQNRQYQVEQAYSDFQPLPH